MNMLLKSLVLAALLPATALAQTGLGTFGYIGKRELRPEVRQDVTHPNGAAAWSFALPGGSCNDEDCRTDRERAQLVQRRADNVEGKAYRYSVSFYLPPDFADVSPANLILWEVKPRGTGKPSAVVEIIGGRLQFSLSDPGRTQADKMNPEKPVIIRSLGPIPRGRWTDVVVDAKWSRSDAGILHVYHNGRRVVSHRGPNIDSNSTRQAVMFGLYRSFVSRYLRATGRSQAPLQRAWFANVGRQQIRM